MKSPYHPVEAKKGEKYTAKSREQASNLQPPGYEPGELPTTPSRINAPEVLPYPELRRKLGGPKPARFDRQGMTPEGRQSISTREEERRILTPVPVYTITFLKRKERKKRKNFRQLS